MTVRCAAVDVPHAAKVDLRREMRARRRAVPDQADRSTQIVAAVQGLEVWQRPDLRCVMIFDAVPGEPDLSALGDWCRGRGLIVVVPEENPDAATVDLVLVPGLAFTAAGERLGQGGGWYDRFLAQVNDRCVIVGVCFAVQICEHLPVEPHDVCMDLVVTEHTVQSAV